MFRNMTEHHDDAHRHQNDPDTFDEVDPTICVFVGMAGIWAKKSPTVSKELLGRNHCGNRPTGDCLRIGLPSASVPIEPASTVVATALPLSVIGIPPAM